MAFLNGISKSNNSLAKKILCSSVKHVHKNIINKSEIDIIDEFTKELMKRKVSKWQTFRETRMKIDDKLLTTLLNKDINHQSFQNSLNIDIRGCNKKTIDNLMSQYLNEQDYKKASLLAEQCVHHEICPSIDILLKFLALCARIGDRDSIQILQQFLKKTDIHTYETLAELKHYLAEAHWIRGNIFEALKLFEEVYDSHVYLRHRINLIIKYLVANIISEKSEAILVNIMSFAENLAVKYKQYHLLVYVWQICVLSDWYADHCRAQEILRRHPCLINEIAKRVYRVVKIAARVHKPEVIHNILELLLEQNMTNNYSCILQVLFEYRYSQNDFRSCSEILQWAAELKVFLPPILELKLIRLLTGEKRDPPKTTPAEDFELKF